MCSSDLRLLTIHGVLAFLYELETCSHVRCLLGLESGRWSRQPKVVVSRLFHANKGGTENFLCALAMVPAAPDITRRFAHDRTTQQRSRLRTSAVGCCATVWAAFDLPSPNPVQVRTRLGRLEPSMKPCIVRRRNPVLASKSRPNVQPKATIETKVAA